MEHLKKPMHFNRIMSVKPPDDIEALLSEYNDTFQGIGCFRDKSKGRDRSQSRDGSRSHSNNAETMPGPISSAKTSQRMACAGSKRKHI